MLGIPKHEEAPPTPPHPLSPMGDACSRMDLTAIHQILVATHYKDDEGTNEVIHLKLNMQKGTLFFFFTPVILMLRSWSSFSVIFPRVDSTNERYAGSKEARRLGIP